MFFFRRHSVKVLVVCTANICRSPMAEEILRSHIADRGLHRVVGVDSAGTHASLSGKAPDPRAQRLCKSNGIDIRRIRARQIQSRDFEKFDYILAMDTRNYNWLIQESPAELQARVSLIGSWLDDETLVDIPDPYFGNQQGFAHVYDLLSRACEAFVTKNLIAVGDNEVGR